MSDAFKVVVSVRSPVERETMHSIWLECERLGLTWDYRLENIAGDDLAEALASEWREALSAGMEELEIRSCLTHNGLSFDPEEQLCDCHPSLGDRPGDLAPVGPLCVLVPLFRSTGAEKP